MDRIRLLRRDPTGRWYRQGRNIVVELDRSIAPLGGASSRYPTGRWFRTGGNVVVALDSALGPAIGPPRLTRLVRDHLAVAGEVGVSGYTVCDFIDARISVKAQYALHAMLRDGAMRAVSLAILGAVKRGLLEGVLVQDSKAAALKAISLGKAWWTLIPSGKDAVCVSGPGSHPPMIIFTKTAEKDRLRLMKALSTAWGTCGVATVPAPPPKGTPCERPPPPPPPPEVIEFPEERVEGKPPCDEDVYYRRVNGCYKTRIYADRKCYDTFSKKALVAIAKAGWSVGIGNIPQAIKQLPGAALAYAEYRKCTAQAKAEWTRCLDATKALKCPE